MLLNTNASEIPTSTAYLLALEERPLGDLESQILEADAMSLALLSLSTFGFSSLATVVAVAAAACWSPWLC